MTGSHITLPLDEIEVLPTAVAIHGSARQADVTGQLCFTIAVALATYASK